jgi:hypothetical protein
LSVSGKGGGQPDAGCQVGDHPMDTNKVIFSAMVIILLFLVFHGLDPLSTSTVTQTITGKNTVAAGFKFPASEYLIYTDQETLEDTDNIFTGKWDTHTIYYELQVGHTYHMTLIGWEIPLIGWHRNILRVDEVKK